MARKLVEAKLAACVNVIPGNMALPHIRARNRGDARSCTRMLAVEASVFTWEGEVSDDDSENMLIVKTRQSLQDEVVEFVKHNHSYECPEVIFLRTRRGAAGARAQRDYCLTLCACACACARGIAAITGGIPGYLQWVTDSTRAPSSSS